MRVRRLAASAVIATWVVGCTFLAPLSHLTGGEAADASGPDTLADGAAPPGDAGIAFVQRTALSVEPGGQIALPAPLGAGDTVLVCSGFSASYGALVVTDTLGLPYTLLASQDGTGTFGGYRVAVLASIGVKAGLDTLTLTTASTPDVDGGAGMLETYVVEYRGIRSLDNYVTAVGSYDAGFAPDAWVAWDAGTLTTTRPGDLVFGFVEAEWGAEFGPTFASRSAYNGNAIADEPAPTPGSYAVTGTANNDWVTIAAAFAGQ